MLQGSQDRIDFDRHLVFSIKFNRNHDRVRSIIRTSRVWNAQDKCGNTLFHIAAKYNNTYVLSYLLGLTKEFDLENDLGKTPLIEAIENNCEATTRTLLMAGANIFHTDHLGNNALQLFTRTEVPDERTVNLFLKKLRASCFDNHEKIADTLHNAGWPMFYVVQLGNVVVTKIMLERGCPVDSRDKTNQTILHKVVQSVDVDHVRLLLEHNADPNAMDDEHRSPLHYLYAHEYKHSNGHFDILKMLVNQGASLALKDDHLNWSQVDLTLKYGNKDAVEILLRANLELNGSAGDGMQNTPIHILATNKTPTILKLLDNQNFQVDGLNGASHTPLWTALLNKNLYAVEYMLKRGANVNGRNRSPLHEAVSSYSIYAPNEGGHKECIELLLDYGAYPQLQTRLWNDSITALELIKQKRRYSFSNIVIAHLTVQEALGTPITHYTRRTLDSDRVFKTYYDFCKGQLSAIVDKSITLLNLLSASEYKFEQYVRNQEWLSKKQRFCNEEKATFCHLHRMLQRRVDKTVQMIKLKMDAARVLCKLLKTEYSRIYLIADRIISYLSGYSLENLLEVDLLEVGSVGNM